jgi:hypothetical protein
MQDLATHANPLSYLPWQETFFVVIQKILNAWPKLGQDKGNILEFSSNHPLTPKHAHTSVWKCKERSPNIATYPTLIVGKLRAWFKSLDRLSRDQNLSILSYFYIIGNLLKKFKKSFVICFMYLMKLFLIMNICVRTLLIACWQ